MANTAYTKANNTTELTQATSWTPNAVLDSTDLGSWALGAANTVTASANIFTAGAIRVTTSQTGNVTIQQPVTLAGLASSVGGLAIGTAVSVDKNLLSIDRALTASASQTWDVASGASFYVGLNNAAGTVSASAGVTVTKKGLGGAGFMRTNSAWVGPLNVEEGQISYGNNATPLGTGAITLNSAGTGTAVVLTPDAGAGTTITLSNNITIGGNVSFMYSGVTTSTMTLSGTVAFGATNKTVTVAASTATISGPITGTAGFTKAGTGTLTLTNTTSGLQTLGGTAVTIGGRTVFGGAAQSGNVLPSVTSIVFNNNDVSNPLIIDSNTAYTHPSTFSGQGSFLVSNTAAAGITFSAGALSGITGTGASYYGFGVYPKVGQLASYVNINDFPAGRLTYIMNGASPAGYVKFVGTTGSHQNYITDIMLETALAGSVTGTPVFELYANGNAGSSFKLSGNVTRSGTNITAATLTLRGTNSNDNELSGNITNFSAGFTLGITKADAGRWILSGTSSAYTGANTVSAGTLSAQSAAALGSSAAGAVSVTSGATLEAAFNGTINKASVGLTLNGTGFGSVGAISTPAGSYATTYSASTITLGSNSSIGADTGSSLTLGTAITGAFALTKVLGGTLVLSGITSSYTGKTTLSAGTLEIAKIANVSGGSSSLGAPTTVGNGTIDISPSTTLRYSGSTNSTTDRVLNFLTGGAYALESTGAGSVNYAGTLSFTASTTNTLTLSGGSNATISSTAIANPAGGTVALTKSGLGTWTLSATNLTYTGDTTVGGGVLNLGATGNRTLSSNIVMTGGILANGAFTIEAATSVTATTGSSSIESVVAGNKTLTVNSGATLTLAPDTYLVTKTGNNTFTGNATINGTVSLETDINASASGKGLVLGSSNTVSVESTGKVYTSAVSSNQAGTARYNNLTFKAGSQLHIGFSAP